MTSNKGRHQTELQVTRRAGQGSKRRGAQTTETVAAKRDGDKGDPEAAPRVTAGKNGSAPNGVEVVEAEGAAQHPAGSDQEPSGSRNGADHNGPERTEQTESPPLQPIVAIAFPLCDAAVRNSEGSEWGLTDAILADIPETGADGVNNHSYAKINLMREEIAKNHGVDLSFERVRKLRQAGSAFPPSRRRLGVSLEGHLEAGTPDELDRIIANAPEGTAFTREYIRRAKHPTETADQEKQKEERRRQVEDQRKGLQSLRTQLGRQNEAQEQRYSELCRTTGTKPEPLLPLPSQEEGTPRPVAEVLEQSLRVLLTLHGFDPTAAALKQAIKAFVTTVLERT